MRRRERPPPPSHQRHSSLLAKSSHEEEEETRPLTETGKGSRPREHLGRWQATLTPCGLGHQGVREAAGLQAEARAGQAPWWWWGVQAGSPILPSWPSLTTSQGKPCSHTRLTNAGARKGHSPQTYLARLCDVGVPDPGQAFHLGGLQCREGGRSIPGAPDRVCIQSSSRPIEPLVPRLTQHSGALGSGSRHPHGTVLSPCTPKCQPHWKSPPHP